MDLEMDALILSVGPNSAPQGLATPESAKNAATLVVVSISS
jgi:hypothetical protein